MCECIQIIPVCLSVCLGSPTHNLRLCCCEWSCELLATGLSLRKMPRSWDPGEDREPLDGHAYLLASRMTKWLLQCLQMRLHTTLVKLFMLSLCQLCEHKTCSHDNVPCKQCLSAVSARQSEWLRLQLADLITLPWVRVPLYERQLHGQYICILSPLAITCCISWNQVSSCSTLSMNRSWPWTDWCSLPHAKRILNTTVSLHPQIYFLESQLFCYRVFFFKRL